MSADASAGEPLAATEAPASADASSASAAEHDDDAAESGGDRKQVHGSHRALVLAALGVVYGDIGTSPLYAFHESVHHIHEPDAPHVLGILSLFFWSIVLVIAIKYVALVLRADNDGEGGILALLALAPHRPRKQPTSLGWITLMVIFGTGLLYGDGIITPAISVLSAVDGLKVASSDPGYREVIGHIIVPLTCVILAALFAVQRSGTARVGRAFGPVMIVWFTVLGFLGLVRIVQEPTVLQAISPHHAYQFLTTARADVIAVLGSVVLCITGGEALYADLGHFGRRPIGAAWYRIVMPALLLNYFGQGALVIANPGVTHTFWGMVPEGVATIALVLLATAATVIASQALITGCYSITRQAAQLGFFPRVKVVHTSRRTEGQIYVPGVNWALAIACIVLVLAFRQPGALAAAYGVAVTGTMLITTIVFFVVVRSRWSWPLARALPILLVFGVIDSTFLGANLVKVIEGGWVTLAVGFAMCLVMITWKQGRALVHASLASSAIPLAMVADGADDDTMRTAGVGVFMAPDPDATPLALLHYFKHSKVLPRTVICTSVLVSPVPWVPGAGRAEVEPFGHGFWRITLRFGFMQSPHVPGALRRICAERGIPFPENDVSYFVGREHFLPTGTGKMA
ncbi:MAG TPA: KUP/HAK/KT family potassium transporter, partial [Nannocystaceae bacterium]|nr:KUP/HAK/KT family potassium transporter [Nannocystaceae bacterium]